MKHRFGRLAVMAIATSLVMAVAVPANASIYRTANGYSINDLYVFGDSLSDVGNVSVATGGAQPPAALGYVDGRFTNGGNYTDYLAASLGLSNTAALAGGNNYAFGGARIDAGMAPPGLLTQYGMYAKSHAVADPNALFIVYGGGNDINDPSVDLTDSLANLGLILGALINRGATNILIPNSPDLGRTPNNNASLNANVMRARTQAYNMGLATLIAQMESLFSINLLTVDVFGFSGQVLDNPTAYGLNNVNDSCLGNAACTDPDKYFYWDGIHPNTQMHALLANEMLSVIDKNAIPEPATLALMVLGVLSLAWRQRRYNG